MVATPDLGSGAERRGGSSPFIRTDAKIAQLVEHNLAKVGVAGSNPVFRSSSLALVVELVDTQDLKSCVRKDVRVQVPSGVQADNQRFSLLGRGGFFCKKYFGYNIGTTIFTLT